MPTDTAMLEQEVLKLSIMVGALAKRLDSQDANAATAEAVGGHIPISPGSTPPFLQDAAG
jgi:hypothetical protein